MGDCTDSSAPVVVVTGFGPFGHHTVNASWEAVKQLKSLGVEDELGIKLVIAELPVEYATVETEVPKLWKQHNPQLVIHVGVSSVATNITLETQARRSGYQQKDVCGNVPERGVNCLCDEECLQSSLDVLSISSSASKYEGVPMCISQDAGRYLCEYSFYSSLTQDQGKALFIHVPELGAQYTAEQLAKGIRGVIREIIALDRDHQIASFKSN